MLRGLDLDVEPGSLTVVVGPSGCGKSTCLRIIAGLEEPDEGSVWVGGRDVSGVRPAERSIGMVFQEPALLPHLTVADNVGFGLKVRKTPRAQAAERVARAMDVVGVTALADRRPAGLSGGEGQLVALARALVRDPDVFLLDEPLSSLDAQVRSDMRARIRTVQQATDGSMLYVTHDQIEAMTLGDRLAVLHDGMIVQSGAPQEVFDRPATSFVATFIGAPRMNLLTASVRDGWVEAGPFAQGVGELAGLAEATTVELGVRPEHVAILSPGDARTRSAEGVVELVEITGSEAFLTVSVSGTTIVARVEARRAPAVGERMHVEPEALVAHVFADGVRVGV